MHRERDSVAQVCVRAHLVDIGMEHTVAEANRWRFVGVAVRQLDVHFPRASGIRAVLGSVEDDVNVGAIVVLECDVVVAHHPGFFGGLVR